MAMERENRPVRGGGKRRTVAQEHIIPLVIRIFFLFPRL